MKNNIYFFAFLFLIFVSCSKGGYESFSTNSDSESGTGGSTARFTVSGNYLYTVNISTLKIFDVSQPASPFLVASKYIGTDIETIFCLGNNLFLGSQNGIYILDISQPASPVVQSTYSHVRSCDPVIADSIYAYVTLNSNQIICGNSTNELQIINIANPTSPYFVKSYNMTNPLGLAKNDTVLFVCDNGIKVFHAANVQNLTQMNFVNFYANDLIVHDSILMAIGDNGFSQYLINGYNLQLISTISASK